uniref:Ig-like domain-containing protein n=1 Tax=Electrophorus electricus TaxID=8005 RepID=A0A4W4GLK6_ELEEL
MLLNVDKPFLGYAVGQISCECTLLTLFLVAPAESPASVELSCGPGPAHVVLETPRPLLLDCHLGAVEAPRNVTWLRDGAVLGESEAIQLLPNGSLLVLPAGRDWQTPAHVEGDYRCLSGSSFGALTSRTVTLQLASKYRGCILCLPDNNEKGENTWTRALCGFPFYEDKPLFPKDLRGA